MHEVTHDVHVPKANGRFFVPSLLSYQARVGPLRQRASLFSASLGLSLLVFLLFSAPLRFHFLAPHPPHFQMLNFSGIGLGPLVFLICILLDFTLSLDFDSRVNANDSSTCPGQEEVREVMESLIFNPRSAIFASVSASVKWGL